MCQQCPSCGLTYSRKMRRFQNFVCPSCLRQPITDCDGDAIIYASYGGYLYCRRYYDDEYSICTDEDTCCMVGNLPCVVGLTGDGSIMYVNC